MNNLVLSFTPKFTKLLTLVLRQENPQLEDTAVETIAKFCHDLQDLDLSKSFKAIGDLGVMSLAYGCPDLRCLDLCGCVRIIERKANIACFEDEDCTDSFSCSGIM
ncbi:hypothetical protein V6Z11_D06G130900 [Gossypium hirsutum]|uniref:F-box protein SKP2A isoform X3 n=1 Tax=Gossypium hirsutum TaxID=3635 RepID=A0A1U8I0W9_GOSHI|nr:F-box protein SKP2A isoform X3 [Gossypium hirsutum]